MPIKIPNDLPACGVLTSENIFVMNEHLALHQDIRPLQIALLNLMPTKIVTETQILRLLGNSPLQVELTFLHPKTYVSKHTPVSHIKAFYTTFDEVKHKKFDGLIITGAPVELLDYEEVLYWDELKAIMDWSKKNVYSTFHICWGAQAALYYHYGVRKHTLDEKAFGIFEHKVTKPNVKLLRGFDDIFWVPQSRHTGINYDDVESNPNLEILSESDETGIYLIATPNGRQIFCTGHSEYDADTLKIEYERDVKKGLDIKVPQNYFADDDPSKTPIVRWRSHANLLYANWLNYYVYQATPYNLDEVDQ